MINQDELSQYFNKFSLLLFKETIGNKKREFAFWSWVLEGKGAACHGDFVLGLNCPKLQKKYLSQIRNAYRTLRGRYVVNFRIMIKVLVSLSRQKATN